MWVAASGRWTSGARMAAMALPSLPASATARRLFQGAGECNAFVVDICALMQRYRIPEPGINHAGGGVVINCTTGGDLL